VTWHSLRFLFAKTATLALLTLVLFAIWWLPHRGWKLIRAPAARVTGKLKKGSPPLLRRALAFAERHFVSSEPSIVRLAIGGLFVALAMWRFLVVLEGVIRDPQTTAADLRIHNTLRLLNSRSLGRFYGVISDLGSPLFILPVAAVLACLLWFASQKREALFVTLSVVLSTGSALILKYWIARPRPVEARNLLSGPSFPSGHALLSVCFYGFLIYLLTRDEAPGIARWTVVPMAALIPLVPIARVYLGAHWPYDAIASLFLGFALLGMLVVAFKFPPLEHRIAGRSGPAPAWFGPALVATMIAITVWGIILSVVAPPPVIRPSPPRPLPLPPQTVVDMFPPMLPKTSEDLAGGPMEPVAFVFVGDGAALKSAFTRAGWAKADNPSVRGLTRELIAVIRDRPDPNGPATPAYYGAQPQDLTFEKPGTADRSIRHRHHIRIWKAGICAVPRCDAVWVATCSYDAGVELVPKPYLVTHHIDPAIDRERAWIAGELRTAGAHDLGLVEVTGTRRGRNAGGDSFVTDGRAEIMLLPDLKPGVAAGNEGGAAALLSVHRR
jgi:membrane-associated phospholipid phosphatase